ncbi:MAG: NAD-dependent malic enzyme [Fusobacteria bacterium]|nr:NAD-dependent malic enzyme [Fusobacteriota bacterium]
MNKVQRTERVVRIKISNVPGAFGKIANVIGQNEGNLGDIKLVRMGKKYVTRDITVYTKNLLYFNKIIEEIGQIQGIKVINHFDNILREHEGGLIEVKSKVKIDNVEKYEKYYMPGMSAIAKSINEDRDKIYDYTNIGNTIGLISNGSTMLDFDDPNEEATYSVLESRAAVINELTNISAIPIVLSTKDKDSIVKTIKNIYKSFGMIIFEDLNSEDSFTIESELSELGIPVVDTNKTCNGIVTLAGLINISELNSVDLSKSKVGFLGYGSKASGINMLLKAYGIKERIGFDIREYSKKRMQVENIEIKNSINELMEEADIVIATSRKAGLIKFGMVKKGQILIMLSKPKPEIEPEIAIKAGARYATDGKIISPLLVIPGLVKGCLLSRAKKLTFNMMLAAAEKLADLAVEDSVLPGIFDKGIHEEVCNVVRQAAIEDGVACLEEIDIEDEVPKDIEDIFESIKGMDLWTEA